METRLTTTLDGSHTLYVPEIDEHYHSVNGAVQESMHIFINDALRKCDKNNMSIFEVGFGTGLNAFLALLEAEQTKKQITFTTIELYPVPDEYVATLNYADKLKDSTIHFFNEIHKSPWNQYRKISDYFTLRKIHGDLTTYDMPGQQYDVVFFDAFSPEKQPEMWSEEIFKKIYNACLPNAILTTYCAKGIVRRTMQQVGFTVERIPGPPGKREILRGIKK